MPVPDEQERYKDFVECDICNQIYPDDMFFHIVADNEKQGAEHEQRILAICNDCRYKCIDSIAFEKAATEKIFKLKLGRKLKREI